MRAAVAGLATVACLAAAAAPAGTGDALIAEGSCRDGVPHGAYALRTASGRLRVIGAYNHGHRTGSFIFWNEAGVRIAHIPFDDDAISGTAALWFPRPARDGVAPQKLEAVYSAGRRNGVERVWYPDGRLRALYLYVDGELTEASAWNARGVAASAGEAAASAARDARQEEADYEALDALVRAHPPACRATR